MSYYIDTIGVLEDNLVYVVCDNVLNRLAVIDAGDSCPILEYIKINKMECDDVLLTHHHNDHIDGVLSLKEQTNCRVIGNDLDSHRLPKLDLGVNIGDKFKILGDLEVEVFPLDGHTLGHLGYYIESLSALFVGDTLFLLGCGRMFEGDYTTYYRTLQLLKTFPLDTRIYFGHNYANVGIAFAKQCIAKQFIAKQESQHLRIDLEFNNYIEEILYMESKGKSPTGIFLSEELKHNPFLKCETEQEFKDLRMKRDIFKY